jgi:hypothetical protein
VALGIERAVAAVGPVVLAIVMDRRLVDDARPGPARPLAVRIDVVDVQHESLRVGVVHRLRAQHVDLPARVAPFAADHQQRLAEGELAVHHLAGIALDLELQLEAEGITQPVDHAVRILVVGTGGHARPAGRWRSHAMHSR